MNLLEFCSELRHVQPCSAGLADHDILTGSGSLGLISFCLSTDRSRDFNIV